MFLKNGFLADYYPFCTTFSCFVLSLFFSYEKETETFFPLSLVLFFFFGLILFLWLIYKSTDTMQFFTLAVVFKWIP